MKKLPVVSFIIPVYNRPLLSHYTINSIIQSTRNTSANIEILVIDDGSTDMTYDSIKQKFPNVILLRQSNGGAPKAINRGIMESSGDFIVIIGSDDLVEDNFLENKIIGLQENLVVDGIYGDWDFFSGIGEFSENRVIPPHRKYPLEKEPTKGSIMCRLLEGWYIPSSAVVWRRRIFDEVGGLKEGLVVNQDVEFLFRVLANNKKLIGCEGGRTLIRDHHSDRVGVVGNSAEKVKAIFDLRKEFYDKLNGQNLWSPQMASSLGTFCFNQWVQYRKIFPTIANDFLKLSRSIFPKFKVRGGFLFRSLGLFLGPVYAVKTKDWISGFALGRLKKSVTRNHKNE